VTDAHILLRLGVCVVPAAAACAAARTIALRGRQGSLAKLWGHAAAGCVLFGAISALAWLLLLVTESLW